MEETFAVIGVFGSIPFITWLVIYFRSKAHARTAALIDKLIDKGETITPELVQTLGIRSQRRDGDFKTGLILVAIALAFICLGYVIPDDEAFRIMTGIASFPFFVGLAFISFWFFFSRKADAEG